MGKVAGQALPNVSIFQQTYQITLQLVSHQTVITQAPGPPPRSWPTCASCSRNVSPCGSGRSRPGRPPGRFQIPSPPQACGLGSGIRRRRRRFMRPWPIGNAPVGRLIPYGKWAGLPFERAMDMNSLREKRLPAPGRTLGSIVRRLEKGAWHYLTSAFSSRHIKLRCNLFPIRQS